ncbi:MAG: nucleotidyltransferase domain-containing protein, partial [Burkholderiales bacterium]|nr:nucleotidyltransferase domain-containing protein [Burkholderiales bacterium]
MKAQPDFGLDEYTARCLQAIFERFDGLERVWIYGSRARGDHRVGSDIDLLADAPDWDDKTFAKLWAAVDDEGFLQGVDLSHWQRAGDTRFKDHVLRDRQLFWQRASLKNAVPQAIGLVELKPFQDKVLEQLAVYLAELSRHAQAAERTAKALSAAEEPADSELMRAAQDYPKKAWGRLDARGLLPEAFAKHRKEVLHSSRFDGAGRAIPNVCLKVPTGGGKTLLATSSVSSVFTHWFKRHTGLVLWVVPNDAIYRQTLKTLSDRD